MVTLKAHIAAAVTLTACTSATALPVDLGQANTSYAVECSALGGSSTRGCLAKADELCPGGYAVIGTSEAVELPRWKRGNGTVFVTCVP